ncbi:Uncharacterised protein [Chlamydia abortus]|nr:Uncharacterised protein [Chlamydia abortus]
MIPWSGLLLHGTVNLNLLDEIGKACAQRVRTKISIGSDQRATQRRDAHRIGARFAVSLLYKAPIGALKSPTKRLLCEKPRNLIFKLNA